MLRMQQIRNRNNARDDKDGARLPQDPSPADIRRECRRIQEEWSESTRQSRQVLPPLPWRVPVFKEGLHT